VYAPVPDQQPPVDDGGGLVAFRPDAARRVRQATVYVETMLRQKPRPRFERPQSPAVQTQWIRLTGPAGPDGGYPWEAVTQVAPLTVTAGGSEYTFANATVSGNGWTGWSVTLTVANGKVASAAWSGSAGATGTANEPPTITVSGDGTGAAVQISDAQDVLTPPQWVTTGTTGSYSKAAYEISGCYGLPNDGTVYPAEAGPAGQLSFFCNPVIVGKTTHVTSYPTGTNVYFAVQPETVYGTQAEGSPGVLNTGPSGGGTYPVLYAVNIGPQPPPEGTTVICGWSGTRWVFRYDINTSQLEVTTHETPSTSLKIDLSAGTAVDSAGTTLTAVAAVSGHTLAASSTNSVYLDASYALAHSTTGMPGSGHFTPLATVTTNGTKVTGVTDARTFTVAARQT
jgi:hypothetical protein